MLLEGVHPISALVTRRTCEWAFIHPNGTVGTQGLISFVSFITGVK
jgi:hypothetical protein